MIKPWTHLHSQQGPSFGIFSIRTDTAISPRTGIEHDFHIMESMDWVNIIPLTADHRVVMIRQYRHGSKEVTLEIPGGLLDPGDTPEKSGCPRITGGDRLSSRGNEEDRCGQP